MNEAFWEKYRSNVDKQVEKAGLAEGMKGNPGAGRPLPGNGTPYRENWWIQDFVKREEVSREFYLPTSLLLKKNAEEVDDEVAKFRMESEVRRHVSELNKRIERWQRRRAQTTDEKEGDNDLAKESAGGGQSSSKPSLWRWLMSRRRGGS